MIIDTILFFFITFISLCSFIGYGLFFDKYFLLKSSNNNQFNFFFLGILFILPISFIYNLFIGNNILINTLILLLGFSYFIFFSKSKNVKINFFLCLLFFSGLIISKTHEDFTTYHFQHVRELTDGSIKFGLANLDERYFYSSIYAYVQSLFRISYFDLNLIHIPIYLFYLSLVGYLFIEIKNKKSYLLSVVLFLIILKFKRISEFGYDYIGQFFLLYLFFEYIWKKKNLNQLENTKLILLYCSSILIKVSNLYFLPIIVARLLMQKKIKKLFNYKKIVFPLFLIIFTFSFNSFLKTGCFNYLIQKSCVSSDKYNWVYDYKKIENSKKLTKNWTRGFYHQKEVIYNEIEFNKNFNWVNHWFTSYFVLKIIPFILLIFLISILIRLTIFKKNFLSDRNIFLIFGIIFTLLIWFLNFPQFRFGFAGIIIAVILFIEAVHGDSRHFNQKNFYIFLITIFLYFNFSNALRISNEFQRSDIYKFNNFPWFAQPKLNYTKENIGDFDYERSAKNKNFWRSCFNANLICVNHDDKMKFNINGRFIFIQKY